LVDRVRVTRYSLPYPYGLFSVPAPPLRTRERRGFFLPDRVPPKSYDLSRSVLSKFCNYKGLWLYRMLPELVESELPTPDCRKGHLDWTKSRIIALPPPAHPQRFDFDGLVLLVKEF
jgi:hypothetical protein